MREAESLRAVRARGHRREEEKKEEQGVPSAATASDADGAVAKVEFFNGATLIGTTTAVPYSFDWVNVPSGAYTLTAKATDNLGAQTTSAAVTVIVNALPTVTLTAPAIGARFIAPAAIQLVASATDADGAIAKVEFYEAANLLATVTSAPYSFDWVNVGAGGYTLTAVATDDKGAVTTSAPVTVTVSSPGAAVYYIHTDHLNTPRVITDQQQRVVWKWDNTDPFGGNVPDEDPDGDGQRFEFNLRFLGQYFDKETNLHYNYFRDYDPGIGRYVQSDPVGLAGGINTYAYVSGNPISLTDPLGLAYFAKRALRGMPWLPFYSCNPIYDFFNVEISHEQLFFEDGKTPLNVGFFDDGTLKTEPNPSGYRCRSGKYNDCIKIKNK